MTTLYLGVSKVDITPSDPIPLAGFGARKGIFEGISSRLYLRANVLRHSLDAEKSTALVVEADIIWWGPERMPGIYQLLFDRFGIPAENIILSASHTHGGPQTTTLFTDTLGLPNAEYMNRLEELLAQAVGEALANLEPVLVETGTGSCQVGINRRKLVDGKMIMAPNPANKIDTNVEVFRFTTDSGAVKAVWMHYTCHPTVSSMNRVNSDYCGAAMVQLEQELGGAVVSFLQGCCGDTRPALYNGDKFYSGDEEVVKQLGQKLADAVLQVLGNPMTRLTPVTIKGRRVQVQLPFQAMPTEDEVAAASELAGFQGEWAVKLRQNEHLLQAAIPLQLVRVDIADGLSLLAMDGEIVLEYSEKIKRLSGGKVLALGYSNGMIGYIPSAQQVVEGGYEGGDSSRLFMLPAVFAPELEEAIEQGIRQLIQ